ncbi:MULTISPECIES: hypothetical protein [Bacillota]|uniref:hypothetical protein n=1 Tax=Bacillota TaxID=1239 RepID=UPI0039F036A0
MNTLLSIANGALQYHRGKQTGLAGLFGIAVALLVAYQWERISPFLDAMGIVDFFRNAGLVYEGEAGLTGLAVFMFVFKLSILFIATLILLMFITLILTFVFTNEKTALAIMMPIIYIVGFPIALLYGLYQLIFNRKKHGEEAERRMLLGNPQDQLLREYTLEVPREQALGRLNRIPTLGDDLFLLGLTEENHLYMLLPRPINFETGKYDAGDIEMIPLFVEGYEPQKYKKTSMFEILPSQFIVRFNKHDRIVAPSVKIKKFLHSNSEDVKRSFKNYRHTIEYANYVKDTQTEYFSTKETILNNLKKTTEKRIFNNLVNRMKMFDANNEDVVKMMLDSEKEMKEHE